MISRRSVLLGAAGAVVAGGTGYWYDRRVPSPSHPVPEGTHERVVDGAFRSAAMRSDVGWTAVFPGEPGPMPMLLHLHGRGGHGRDVRRYGPFLADYVQRGGQPFAVVGVDGGNHSYYHRRADGTDPQAMLLDELLPVMRARGLRVDRFAVGGVSMGGYGALLLSETLGPKRVVSCTPDSPAVFASARDRAKGSFDSDADFHEHDVVAGAARLAGIPVRVTCGTSDPFLPGVKRLLAAYPRAERDLSRGGHDRAFWLHVAPAQIAFAGRHLAAA